MRKQRLVVVVAALLAAAVLALLWRPIRDELRIERLRRSALADRDKLAWEHAAKLPESWRTMDREGDAGFFAMARLLEHPDTLVWFQALTVIDFGFAREDMDGLVAARKGTIRDTKSVLAALRERYPLGYLRYLMFPAYAHGTDWRSGGSLSCDGGEDCRVNLDVPPNERSLLYCEDVLQEKVEHPGWSLFRRMSRAVVHGLCGMLPRGRIPDLDPEGRSIEGRALRALRTYVAEGTNPSTRLHAVKAYLRRIGREPSARPVLFEDWLALAKLHWPQTSHAPGERDLSLDESFFQPNSEDFSDPRELAALVRIEDPVVLRILIRLDREDPSFKARLDAAVATEIPGFGPAPAWRPFEEKAKRWLHGKPEQRAGAALALVDLGGEESRRTIVSALAEEPDSDLRPLFESCLAALGDRERLEACRAGFEARLAERLEEWRQKEGYVMGEHIREYLGWGLHDMAGNLLRGGDASLLERAVDLAAQEEGTDLFVFALARAIPALPLWEIFEVGLSFVPVAFSDSEDEPDPERPAITRLRRWWSENGPRLQYDPATRTFVLP
jgi:hypothetical protein